MSKLTTQLTSLLVAALVAIGMIAMTSSVSGQDSSGTPEAHMEGEAAVQLHPAHIHSGTCSELGDVVFPLNDVQSAAHVATDDATPEAGDMAMASPSADDDLVAQGGTVVEASLEAILGDEHAINVHESAENISNYIACGEITGEPMAGEITIALEELNDSGYSGEAILTDNGDGTTTVHVTLFPDNVDATPVATPAS